MKIATKKIDFQFFADPWLIFICRQDPSSSLLVLCLELNSQVTNNRIISIGWLPGSFYPMRTEHKNHQQKKSQILRDVWRFFCAFFGGRNSCRMFQCHRFTSSFCLENFHPMKAGPMNFPGNCDSGFFHNFPGKMSETIQVSRLFCQFGEKIWSCNQDWVESLQPSTHGVCPGVTCFSWRSYREGWTCACLRWWFFLRVLPFITIFHHHLGKIFVIFSNHRNLSKSKLKSWSVAPEVWSLYLITSFCVSATNVEHFSRRGFWGTNNFWEQHIPAEPFRLEWYETYI